MSNPHIQCFLFLVSEAEIPDTHGERNPKVDTTETSGLKGAETTDDSTAESSDESASDCSSAETQLPTAFYAVLPHIECFNVLHGILVKNGVTVLEDQEFDSTLTDALKENRVDVIEIFLELESVQDDAQLTAIVERSHQRIVKSALPNCKVQIGNFCFINLNRAPNCYKVFDEENLRVLKQLASLKSDIRYRDVTDATLLHFATKHGYEPLVQILLECGVDPNLRTPSGKTLLHLAVQSDVSNSMLSILLQHGADINATITAPGIHFDRATVLHLALYLYHDLTQIKYLVDNGALVDVDSGLGHVLELAVDSNDAILDFILSQRPDVNSLSNKAAFRAVLSLKNTENRGRVKMLVRYGFRLAPEEIKNATLVSNAFKSWSPELILDLLKWGVSVCYKGSLVKELVARAISCNQVECLMLFLELDDTSCSESFYFSRAVRAPVFLSTNSEYAEHLLKFGDLSLDFVFLKDELESVDSKAFKDYICRHVPAVIALDLPVNKKFIKNSEFFHEDKLPEWLLEAVCSPTPEECLRQVAAMKGDQIGDSDISIYDLLDTSIHQIARCLRNSNVAEALNSERYSEKYPIYAGMIKWRLQRAQYRRNLIDKGIKILDFLFKKSPDLIDECKKKILEYLSNIDLLVLNSIREKTGDALGVLSQLKTSFYLPNPDVSLTVLKSLTLSDDENMNWDSPEIIAGVRYNFLEMPLEEPLSPS